jgi:GNAT superfamily N-acetyltransferase
VPPGYEILPARREHAHQLPDVERAAATLFAPEDLSPEQREQITPESEFEAAAREGRLWVAMTDDGRAVGFALAGELDGDAHLLELDVHPDHGRKGIGAALVRRVVAWARVQRFPALTLTTFRHLPWNAPFYQRLGFRILSAHEHTPAITAVLVDQEGRGLVHRVAMRLELCNPCDRA